jgi:hypothetical protein
VNYHSYGVKFRLESTVLIQQASSAVQGAKDVTSLANPLSAYFEVPRTFKFPTWR